jgi:uncharacterized protein YecE (DUF72 family)
VTPKSHPHFSCGTSGWSYKDWVGPFYPPGTPASKFLEHYATRFKAVEIDSTFYRIPSTKSVEAWNRATPEGFLFTPKMVREVTHERFLEDADDIAARFLDALAPIEAKLGSVILQFRYFKKAEGITLDAFLARLLPFLDALPRGYRFSLEVRNKTFLRPPLLDALRERDVSLVLNDHPWMPKPSAWSRIPGVFTARHVLVRLLGDRYAIEDITKTWGKTVLDKGGVVRAWAQVIAQALDLGCDVTAFANNHFSGYGPDSAELLFESVQEASGTPWDP